MKIANLKIGTRLTMGFGFLCVALVFMVGQGTVMLGRINEGTDTIVNKRLPRVDLSNRLQKEVTDVALALRNMMLNDDAADRARQHEEIASSRREIDVLLGELDKTLTSEQGREILRRQQESQEKYTSRAQELLKLVEAGDDAGARAYLAKELRPVLAAYLVAIGEQIKMQKDLSAADAEAAAKLYQETRMFMVVLGLVVLALAGAIGWWITRSITHPLKNALDVATAVAAGDLTTKVEVSSTCEVGQLLGALKTMNENLVATVTTVRTGTDAIATASSQVSAGNQDLSARTEQQASSLEETASSMEELTGTVRQNADNARQANTLAETASGVATRGGEVIAEVVDTMAQIHAASGKITDIISVIDGLAFQTNLLALNAAVEAARAGEQGRGFAVVAGEVRNLAQRSAAAAKEIKTLIDDSSGKVEAGTRLVQQAGTTMTDIVDSVRRVTDILGEISSASQEQSAGIEQVNQAITQMDDVTQQNAALVEEAAAASQALQEQASRLAEAVAVFKLDGASVQAAAPAEPAARAAVAKPAPAALPAARPALKPVVKPAVKPVAAAAQRAAARQPTADEWEEF
ncbi:methyl-accepting chemotaxis protein [Massilia sp. YIM B02763]|uniref:methyl-accepting chemotaxis protein n=1 Tax=Massilia sp. YIM B02763 TaxID=3050130 RepID=UPI0025B6342E|nr:methyl-accepting chemotaxis protein [Massilia sp. YIM B02763]MDN4053092.1 methyl-accepting chemotaxis protein [Massilia sp. YIM B02763]